MESILELINRFSNNECIEINKISDVLDDAVNVKEFYSLSFDKIQQIFQNYLTKNKSKSVKTITEMLKNMSLNDIKETPMLLNDVDIPTLTFDECISIIGSLETSPVCKLIKEMHETELSAPKVNYLDLLVQRDNEITTLKSKLEYLAGLNPVEKPHVCESNICDACEKGDFESVRFLIEREKVNIDTKNESGVTPLICACSSGNLQIAEYLINKGANINLCDDDWNTPLHIAARGGHLDIVKCLVENGAFIEASSNASTPLFMACCLEYFDIVGYLVDRGADIDATNADGLTCLSISCCKNSIKAIDFLISKGADINACDFSGWSPLFYAAKFGFTEVAKHLIENGANVNLADTDGNTALFVAISRGFIDIVKLLIAKDVDLSATNYNGKNALSIAKEKNFTEIVQFLIESGAK